MFPALRAALLALAIAALAVSVLRPDNIVAPASLMLVTLVALACIFIGVRKFQPRRSWRSHLEHPGAWELIGAGLVIHSAARFLNLPEYETSGVTSFARSVLGISSLMLTGYALMQMAKHRFGDGAKDHIAEAAITAVAISMVVWAGVIEPVLRVNGFDLGAGPAGAIDITSALVLACLAAHIVASFEERPIAFLALTTSQGILVVAAIVSFVGDHGGRAELSYAASALPALTAMLIGLAALEPTMSYFEEPAGPAGARLNKLRLANLVFPAVLGPCLLTAVLTGLLVLSPFAIATFTIALSLLVVGHLIAMVQARASSTHWASHDKLTGLPNRALFRERSAQALERARNVKGSVAIMYLDLDRFKQINDSLGHEAGDQLLEHVARRILACVDEGDTVARLGGDEFGVLLPLIENEDVPARLAQRLLKKFSSPFNLKARAVFMSPSVGIAISETGTSLTTLLYQADTAMYRAKEAGRNNYAVWTQEMKEASKHRLMLETHLHTAIQNDELRLLYQPKVNLESRQVVGVEALIRWHHPTLGVISPTKFIHLAEESGLINQIGEWVLETACEQANKWHENGFTDLTMAVNLSTRQFQHQNLADLISRTLRKTQLSPELLELELTESVAMSGDEATLATINDLRHMGVRCTIDDFGTGYSNLSYLSRFPIDALKIDKAFVGQIDKSGGDATIVIAIIAMAHGLGLKVVAEGVETTEQAQFLANQQCDEMQGYLFSKPVPPEELENLLMLEHVTGGAGRLGLDRPLTGNQPRRLEREMPSRERLKPFGDHTVRSAEKPRQLKPFPVEGRAIEGRAIEDRATNDSWP